jgi:hypothetical protein
MPVISVMWVVEIGSITVLSQPGQKAKGNISQKTTQSQVQVAHTFNPNYSGGRDQEDCGSKPARANSSKDPILKIPIAKTGW